MTRLFILSMIFVIYTYLGYPVILYVRSWLFNRPVNKGHVEPRPFVSIVIAAKNEGAAIENRLINLLAIDYPGHRYEIVVVSDGSTDDTRHIVNRYMTEYENISLVSYTPSRGKPFALNKGVKQACGEIIVFTDSRQRFDTKAVRELVANFTDPEVGCVSGELIFDRKGPHSTIQNEMGIYWRYEKMIRKMESQGGSVVGVTGAVYAVKRVLFKQIPQETILDDVWVPMTIVMQGYRCVFDPDAIAYDSVSKNIESEMARKIRTLAGNWQLLKIGPGVILPGKNRIWWQVLSHKIFRLLVPFALIYLFVANFFILESVFVIMLWIQIGFYGLGLLAHLMPGCRDIRSIRLIYFFLSLNYAALLGAWAFFFKDPSTLWKKSEGSHGR